MILCGATAATMAEFLLSKRMRILTNSLGAAGRLMADSDNEVFFAGGVLRVNGSPLTATPDVGFVRGFYADRIFVGASGLSSLGLTAGDSEAEAAYHLLGQAREVIVLAESAQLRAGAGLYLCGLEQVSCVITDDQLAVGSLQTLLLAGTLVKQVNPRDRSCSTSLTRAGSASCGRSGGVSTFH
ncbi:hypothetical protein [Duganella guangzhouensis]|uniref:hypothetical protein n=1 Tax=Duganella guangzhouensis TaxID=2666084 RepID=UPI0035315F6E